MSETKQKEKVLRPFYCRTGAKTLMRFQIFKYIPDHMIYVEPFLGGGAVFWNKTSADASIINDLDKKLISDYKLIKTASTDLSKYPSASDVDNLNKKTQLINKTNKNKYEKVVEAIIRRCGGFGSTYVGDGKRINAEGNKLYKNSDPIAKIKNIQLYKDKLKNTIIKSQDYRKLIKDYDTDKTFFYLDPPYENSKGLYKDYGMDYEEMAYILKNIKGKFALSINGSPYIKKTFKDFKIVKLELKTSANYNESSKSKGIGNSFFKEREELLIMNY